MKFGFNRATALVVISSAFLMVAAAGCKKSNSGGGGSGSMSATVGGTAWANSFSTVGVDAYGLFDIIGIQFKGGDSTSFSLEFTTPITLNLPMNSDTAAIGVAYTDSKSGNQYAALTGIIGTAILTVTSYDSTSHTIGGTFSGVLYNAATFTDSVIVTNGKFNTSYTVN